MEGLRSFRLARDAEVLAHEGTVGKITYYDAKDILLHS